MTSKYNWFKFYKTAVLETDWTKMLERIATAESAMNERQGLLSEDHGSTPQERQALAAAINGLRTLRKEAADWQDRRTPNGTLDSASTA